MTMTTSIASSVQELLPGVVLGEPLDVARGVYRATLTGESINNSLGCFIATSEQNRAVVVKISVPLRTALNPAGRTDELLSGMNSRFAEYRTHTSLSHPHIAEVVGYVSRNGVEALVTEDLTTDEGRVLDLGTWANERRALGNPLHTDTKFYNLVTQVCSALAYLDKEGTVHGDIKEPHVLIKNGSAKIIDFGTAQRHDMIQGSQRTYGTQNYLSPEQELGFACPKTDVYALGVTLFRILTEQKEAFTQQKGSATKYVVRVQNATPELAEEPELCNIVDAMRTANSKKRPSAEECETVFNNLAIKYARTTSRSGAVANIAA